MVLRYSWLVALVPLVAPACNNECDFHERCDGNVREICGEDDQVVNRKIERVPCEAPSGACVEIEDDTRCVEPPPTTCDKDTYVSSCDGDLLRTCEGVEFTLPVDFPTHYVTAVDCAATGKTCAVVSGQARCDAG